MPSFSPLALRNASATRRRDVPDVTLAEWRAWIVASVRTGCRIASLFGMPEADHVRLIAVLADDSQGKLLVASTVAGSSYPALTPECPQAHGFERELAEQWGIVPLGHPWLKPVRFHHSYRPGSDAWNRPADSPVMPGVTNHFQAHGDELHEVAVGPVHAGIIEPGHFRFLCHGELVLHLEIMLGYQHRGVERHLLGGPDARTIHYLETLAGDTSIGHALAYAQAREALAQCPVPLRAQALRGIALELERLANHTGDLGALANDVAFLPTASFCGRIRGDFLNMTALFCGNRFGRGTILPGGTGFDADPALLSDLSARLDAAAADLASASDLLWRSSSVVDRFEHTGVVPRALCDELGLVGVAARASGAPVDVRSWFASGCYTGLHVLAATSERGDVFARAQIRVLENHWSIDFIRAQIAALAEGPSLAPCAEPAPDSLAVSLVEGWRGEICHVALTDPHGRFALYKIVDPSFHNWMGLALALRNAQISDFPLCNKSFNLSYCGHDL